MMIDAKDYSPYADLAERVTVFLKSMGRVCPDCTRRSPIACSGCGVARSKALVGELETGNYRLGLVDLNTGKLERRDPGKNSREADRRYWEREKVKKGG